ncbi:hypothetical protein C8R46DRAFT_1184747, partial [Mycena filopes]
MRLHLSLLFNPVFRVWTFRFLLASISLVIISFLGPGLFGPLVPRTWLVLAWLSIVHHILAVFRWPIASLAIIDLVWTLLELAGALYTHVHLLLTFEARGSELVINSLTLMVIALTFSIIFRIATIAKSSQPFLRQRFEFLGGCTSLHPLYTPARILLNRSIARPLVRRESQLILFLRGVVIWCIGLGVPTFAFYTIVLEPVGTHILSQTVSPFPPPYGPVASFGFPGGDASLMLRHADLFDVDRPFDVDLTAYSIQMRVVSWDQSQMPQKNITTMTVLASTTSDWVIGSAPGVNWFNVLNVSISLTLPPGKTGVYVMPVQIVYGALYDWLQIYNTLLDSVLLVHGSNLVGTFTWTRRDVIVKVGWNIFSPPTMPVFTAKFNNLQPFAQGASSDPNTVTLTLVQMAPGPTEYLRDTAESTVLNGIATFGGFWTFLNGGFALFFGANVLYFAFGRRPLSALGIVHLFQRGRLQQQWNEDFPAIRTEGGLPGSESAGIVAFIRERLVDLGEDPHKVEANHPDDVEAQRPSGAQDSDTEETSTESIPAGVLGHSRMRESGYILDEIPLLDVDLGLESELMN